MAAGAARLAICSRFCNNALIKLCEHFLISRFSTTAQIGRIWLAVLTSEFRAVRHTGSNVGRIEAMDEQHA